MTSIKRLFSRLKSHRGASAVEYSTLLAVICVALAPVVSSVSEGSQFSLQRASNAISGFQPQALMFYGGGPQPLPSTQPSTSGNDGEHGANPDHGGDPLQVAQDDGGGSTNGTPGSNGYDYTIYDYDALSQANDNQESPLEVGEASPLNPNGGPTTSSGPTGAPPLPTGMSN
jgi:Flp pilus assembly pilin Flp